MNNVNVICITISHTIDFCSLFVLCSSHDGQMSRAEDDENSKLFMRHKRVCAHFVYFRSMNFVLRYLWRRRLYSGNQDKYTKEAEEQKKYVRTDPNIRNAGNFMRKKKHNVKKSILWIQQDILRHLADQTRIWHRNEQGQTNINWSSHLIYVSFMKFSSFSLQFKWILFFCMFLFTFTLLFTSRSAHIRVRCILYMLCGTLSIAIFDCIDFEVDQSIEIFIYFFAQKRH